MGRMSKKNLGDTAAALQQHLETNQTEQNPPATEA